jgi:hypothetical protein
MDKSGMLTLVAKVFGFRLWGRVLLSAVRLASSADLFESHPTLSQLAQLQASTF